MKAVTSLVTASAMVAAVARAELVWHFGGPTDTMLAQAIMSIEASPDTVYIGTTGVRTDPCQVIAYSPASASRRTLYKSSSGQNCNVMSLRKQGSYLYVLKVAKASTCCCGLNCRRRRRNNCSVCHRHFRETWCWRATPL